MFDFKKLDIFFAENLKKENQENDKAAIRRKRILRGVKLLLPAVAAALAGLLIILPGLREREGDFKLEINKPKAGELEKLHMENTVFYITDKQNRVNNFIAETIDETEPGSKLIKLIRPEGLLPSSDNQWLSIKSPVGFYDQNKNLLRLDDNVKMIYSDGMTANTKTVYYDGNQAKAYGNTPVTSEGYLGNLQSEGFEYYKDRNVIIFTGNTKIIIHQDNDGEREE